MPPFLEGDYNLIIDGNVDYMGSNVPVKNKFNEHFEDFLISYNLEDIWRKKNPGKKQFTFKQKQPVVQTRLDYWFNFFKLRQISSHLSHITIHYT